MGNTKLNSVEGVLSSVCSNSRAKEMILSEVNYRVIEIDQGLKASFQTLKRNNGVSETGITICKEGDLIAPVFCIEEMARLVSKGQMDVGTVADSLIDSYKHALEIQPDSAEITKEAAKKNLIAIVVNYEKNKEKLMDAPMMKFGDLAVAVRLFMKPSGSVFVTNGMCELFEMTPKETLETALYNTVTDEYEVKSIFEKMLETVRISSPADFERIMSCKTEAHDQMLVITNKRKFYGATGIYVNEELRNDVRKRLDGDFYILPSSIHEAIAVPAKYYEIDYLASMVEQINDTSVYEEDFLSDNIYFVGEDLKPQLVGSTEEFNKMISEKD